jgi:hypothetical protein
MDLKAQATLAVELAKGDGYTKRRLCDHDRMLAVGLALRDLNPAFGVVMCDFPSGVPMLAGTSLMAVALHHEPFNMEGDWGWGPIFSRHKQQSGQSYPGTLSANEVRHNNKSAGQFEVSGDDWFDLVDHNLALIDDIQEMGDWLRNAIRIQIDHGLIEQATPHAPTPRTSKRL